MEYRQLTLMPTENSIGWAVDMMKLGYKVTRKGWNGKDMWIKICHPTPDSNMTQSYVYMKTVDNMLVPWLCSQTDLLAEDWVEYGR